MSDVTKTKTKTAMIPRKLRDRDRWVVWRGEKRNGKTTKVPYRPDGRKASSTKPATWCSFKEAYAAFRADDFDGVGYVFSADDPFVGIDLDHCRDVETDEIAPWAQKIIDKLDSYTEISPSGRGLHIIVRGGLPPGGNRRGDIEMYDHARFFCMTGDHLEGTPETIKQRPKALARLHRRVFRDEHPPAPPSGGYGDAARLADDELIGKAKASKNGARFTALYDGGWEQHYVSPSEADLALVGRLAWWTDHDAKRIDRLFRQSGLMRPKWNQVHYSDGRTYGQGTVEKACGGGKRLSDHIEGEFDQTETLRFRTAREISRSTPEKPPWRVPPFLADGSITELVGQPKASGKTTLAMRLARAVLDGGDFLGQQTVRSPAVVMLTEERSSSFREALRRAGLEDCRNLHVLTHQDAAGESWPTIVEAAAAKCRKTRAKVLIVDTLPKFVGLTGDAENQSGPAMEAMTPIQQVTHRLSLASLVNRHERKGGGEVGKSGRGSGAYTAEADICLLLKRPEGNTRPTIRIIEALSRFDETPESMTIELTADGYVSHGVGIHQVVAEEAEDAILEALANGTRMSEKKIIEMTGHDRGAVRRALEKLQKDERIDRQGDGKSGDPYTYAATWEQKIAASLLSDQTTSPMTRKTFRQKNDDLTPVDLETEKRRAESAVRPVGDFMIPFGAAGPPIQKITERNGRTPVDLKTEKQRAKSRRRADARLR